MKFDKLKRWSFFPKESRSTIVGRPFCRGSIYLAQSIQSLAVAIHFIACRSDPVAFQLLAALFCTGKAKAVSSPPPSPPSPPPPRRTGAALRTIAMSMSMSAGSLCFSKLFGCHFSRPHSMWFFFLADCLNMVSLEAKRNFNTLSFHM